MHGHGGERLMAAARPCADGGPIGSSDGGLIRLVNGADDGTAFWAGFFFPILFRSLSKHLCTFLAQTEVKTVKNYESCRCIQAQTALFSPWILHKTNKQSGFQTGQTAVSLPLQRASEQLIRHAQQRRARDLRPIPVTARPPTHLLANALELVVCPSALGQDLPVVLGRDLELGAHARQQRVLVRRQRLVDQRHLQHVAVPGAGKGRPGQRTEEDGPGEYRSACGRTVRTSDAC